MRFVVVAVLVAQLAGCNFAVKHPAVTAGIVVGSIGLATCSLTTSFGTEDGGIASSPRSKCYGVTAGAGIGIALIAAFALWLGYEDDVSPGEPGPGGPTVDPTNLPPAPVFVPKPTLEPKPEPEPEPKPEPPNPEPEPTPAPPP